jgi:DNA-binding CsgD family transcriptional regulator
MQKALSLFFDTWLTASINGHDLSIFLSLRIDLDSFIDRILADGIFELEPPGFKITFFLKDNCDKEMLASLLESLRLPAADPYGSQKGLSPKSLQYAAYLGNNPQKSTREIRDFLKFSSSSVNRIIVYLRRFTGKDTMAGIFFSIFSKAPRLTRNVKLEKISDRNLEAINLLISGLSNMEIAKRMNICYQCVVFHKKSFVEIMNANNMLDALSIYLKASGQFNRHAFPVWDTQRPGDPK